MSLLLLAYNFRVDNQFLGVIVQYLSNVLEFTVVDPLAIDEFTDLCDELAGPFESRSFDSDVSEISLLCTCEVCRN